MEFNETLHFDGGFIKNLEVANIHDGYINGLNDPQVNFYLDAVRLTLQTKESVAEFVRANKDSCNSILWGIWLHGETDHLGTIRLHGIDRNHRIAYIGICIFNKKAQGKGVGTKALEVVTNWAHRFLNLRWIEAGIYVKNYSSQRAFLNAGYEELFSVRGKYLIEGQPMDVKIYAHKKFN